VVPVTPAVTALATIVAPPEFFGTRSRTEPSWKCTSRPAFLKLKIEFAPSRVIVRSENVSSERALLPVRTAVASPTRSFRAAGGRRGFLRLQVYLSHDLRDERCFLGRAKSWRAAKHRDQRMADQNAADERTVRLRAPRCRAESAPPTRRQFPHPLARA
jgi:hypothetical protein